MNAYVDSSVVLRIVLREPERLRAWGRIDQPIASELIKVECLRTIDRARIQFSLGDEAIAALRSDVLNLLSSFRMIPLDPSILEAAAAPFPTSVKTLDAIHLRSAVTARTEIPDVVIATHDHGQAIAGRALGFKVLGAPDN